MSAARHYVASFIFSCDGGSLLLVQKLKPDWQAGKLNGVGGKLEPGEDVWTAAEREFLEEAGFDPGHQEDYCTLRDDHVVVTFFRGWSDAIFDAPGRNDIGERLMLVDPWLLPSNVIPNLRWLVPMALDGALRSASAVVGLRG